MTITDIPAATLPAWLNPDVIPDGIAARLRGAMHDLGTVAAELDAWAAAHEQTIRDADALYVGLPEGVDNVACSAIGWTGSDGLIARLRELGDLLQHITDPQSESEVDTAFRGARARIEARRLVPEAELPDEGSYDGE